MDQENYDEENPNLDGDYRAVLKQRLRAEQLRSKISNAPNINSEPSSKLVDLSYKHLQAKPSKFDLLRDALFAAADIDDAESLERLTQDKNRVAKSLTDYKFRMPETGETVLHRALLKKAKQAFKFLISYVDGPQLAAATFDSDVVGELCKRSCLHLATESGDVDMVKQLMAAIQEVPTKRYLLQLETAYVPPGRRPRNVPCLHIAAMCGYTDIVEYFVTACGADVNTKNEKKDTALMWATVEGKTDTVNLLMKLGATINDRNDKGSTALHYAIRCGQVEIARRLIELGHADVNARRERGLVCPLVLAATLGLLDIVQLLIQYGADVSSRIHGGETALHYAAGEGHIQVCQALITAGIDVDAVDSKGETALIEAATHDQAETLALLAARGADINHMMLDKRTAWTFAVQLPDDKVLKAMLHHVLTELRLNEALELSMSSLMSLRQASLVTLPTGVTPLHTAAKLGDVGKLRLMLNCQLDPDSRDSYGNTFLHVAAEHNQVNVLVEFCTDKRASFVNDDGNTPLHEACKFAHDEAVSILLTKTRIQDKNNIGRTVLHEAAKAKNIKASTIHVLVAQMVQGHFWDIFDAKDNAGCTALHLAVKSGNKSILKELKGLNLYAKDDKGDTPFHIAVARNDVDLFAELLNMHIRDHDLNVENDAGMTLMHLAIAQHNVNVVQYLIKAGADVSQRDLGGSTVMHWLADLIKSDTTMVKVYMQTVSKITDMAVTWWSLKHKLLIPQDMSHEYQIARAEALASLFGTTTNKHGLSVIQYTASIGCVPLLEHIFNLPHVYKLKHGSSYEYDVTNLTPSTVVAPSRFTNRVHPELPAEDDYGKDHRASEHGKVTLSDDDTISLLEIIVSNEDPQSAAATLNIQPIAEMVSRYWSTYQWVFVIGMLCHLTFMAFLTAYGPFLLRQSQSRSNMSAIFELNLQRYNCSNLQPAGMTQYLLVGEPSVLLIAQIAQLGSCRRRVAAFNWKSRAAFDSTAVVGPILLRICGTVFSLATIAWVIMYSYCLVNQDFVLAVALVFGWLFPLHFTRGFESIHQFSLMLRHMVFEDVLKFLAVYFFILCGFGFSQYVILFNDSDYADYTIQDTLFTTFQWLIGMNSFWNKPVTGNGFYSRYGFMAVLYIVYVVMSTMILINLLIAMMSDSYREVKSKSAMLWKVASIEMALDTQKTLAPVLSVFTKLRARRLFRESRRLRFDLQKNRWYLQLAKPKAVVLGNGSADVNTSIIQIGQKLTTIQETVDSLAAVVKHLVPNPQDELPTLPQTRRIGNVGGMAWKKVLAKTASKVK